MERTQYWYGSVVWISWANGVSGHPLNETFLPQIRQLSYEPCSFILEAFGMKWYLLVCSRSVKFDGGVKDSYIIGNESGDAMLGESVSSARKKLLRRKPHMRQSRGSGKRCIITKRAGHSKGHKE